MFIRGIDTLSLGAELRYNNDPLTVNLLNENETYKQVLPKFTARYQPTDELAFKTAANLFASDHPVEEQTA